MTRPTEVTVQVADLEIAVGGKRFSEHSEFYAARERLRAAIPEPEWEPTDDMRAMYRRARGWLQDFDPTEIRELKGEGVRLDAWVDEHLRAMHREGLL